MRDFLKDQVLWHNKGIINQNEDSWLGAIASLILIILAIVVLTMVI